MRMNGNIDVDRVQGRTPGKWQREGEEPPPQVEEGLGMSDGPALVEESLRETKVNHKVGRMKNRKDPAEMKVIRLKTAACIHITM